MLYPTKAIASSGLCRAVTLVCAQAQCLPHGWWGCAAQTRLPKGCAHSAQHTWKISTDDKEAEPCFSWHFYRTGHISQLGQGRHTSRPCGLTPGEQQSAPKSCLPSGTGSAPSQREGCHLQHWAALPPAPCLALDVSQWTIHPLKWRLDDSSMAEIGNVLKLVSCFRNAEVGCLKGMPCLHFFGVLLLQCEYFLFYSVLSKPLH